jgi:DNA-binding GntR family transcriptional regulator
MLETPIDVVFADGIPFKSKSPRYRETIYAAVKEAILSGQLIPNQPLVEEQLAATLNVSRTPVREALALLEHEGFIAPRNGRGLYVRAVTHQEFMEMFIANEAVEPYMARRAALMATDSQLAAIEEAVRQAKQCSIQLDTAGFLRASRDFHRLVGEAAGNRPLADFVVRNEERTDMYLINYGKVVRQERMAASIHEHRAILSALQERDPEAAERLVIYHAQSLRDRFTELFNEESVEEEESE